MSFCKSNIVKWLCGFMVVVSENGVVVVSSMISKCKTFYRKSMYVYTFVLLCIESWKICELRII